MTMFFKDICKLNNKIEYLVIGLYRESICQRPAAKPNHPFLTYYISEFFGSEMIYGNKCYDLEIVKARPTIGDERYRSTAVDYFAIPVVKVQFNRDILAAIKKNRDKARRWSDAINNFDITNLVRKYTKKNVPVVFKKSKKDFNSATVLHELWYEGTIRSYSGTKHQNYTYYTVLENNPEGIYYLNPESQSAIEFSSKIGTFEIIWRELINRKLKEYGFYIPENQAKPNVYRSYKGDTSIDLNRIYGSETYKVDKVMKDIKNKVSELIKKELQENLKDFIEVLDKCKIDSENIMARLHNSMLEGYYSVNSMNTTIDLKELTHDK